MNASTIPTGPYPAAADLPGCTGYDRLGDPATSAGRVPVDLKGDVSPDYTFAPLQPGDDPATFSAYHRAMLASVDAWYAAWIAKGFVYQGVVYPLDTASREQWHGLLTLSASLAFPILITAQDGLTVTRADQATALAIAGAALSQFVTIGQTAATYRQAIAGATTAAALDAISLG